jgi:hypothetical protein
MIEDNHQRSGAEAAIGCAVLDMLAEAHVFNGFFSISVEDDGGFLLQLLEFEEGEMKE